MLSKLEPNGTAFSPIDASAYPDGTPYFRDLEFSSRGTYLFRGTSLQDLLAALFYFDALMLRGAFINHFILPWIPGARQDRLNDSGDVLFTLKSVAQLINARNINHVWVLDPHSDVAPALIDRCHVIHSDVLAVDLARYGIRCDGVIAPDGGAVKRAERWARKLNVPVHYAGKRRDPASGALSGFWCEPLDGGHYLVVDDICDGGGTFIGLADRIKGQNWNVKLSLFVTHGLFTKGTDELMTRFERVITTNSLIEDTVPVAAGVSVLRVIPIMLAETLRLDEEMRRHVAL